MRPLRFKRPNPVLVFHLLVLLLVVASMAAAGGKQVCAEAYSELDSLRCGVERWGARLLDGGAEPGLADLAGLAQAR